jgi:hypothetical protein
MTDDKVRPGEAYEIRFEGTLEVEPSKWLDGPSRTEVVREGNVTTTCLTLRVADQAALRGVLNRLWDLHLTLTSVRRIEAAPGKEDHDGC